MNWKTFTQRKWARWTAAVLALLLVGAVGYWWGVRGKSGGSGNQQQSGGSSQPTAEVAVAPIERKRITETAVAYGTVVAQPGKANAISVPFEIMVRHILVAAGESVEKGTRLVSIAPSPATRLKVNQARAAYEAAKSQLAETQHRYDLKFATNQDLSTAKKAAESAQLEWQNLSNIPNETGLTADQQALVGKLMAQDGQIVPPGQPLIELVDRNQIEVKLDVEPEDATYLHVGDPVKLFPVHADEAPVFSGRVRLISQRVNPDTHLVDVYVSPPQGTRLLLDASIRAVLNTASDIGLVVPRAAVLPGNRGDELFIVGDGHAEQHRVRTKLETDKEVEIDGFGLRPGESVVVQGNHELSDGMAVKVNPQP